VTSARCLEVGTLNDPNPEEAARFYKLATDPDSPEGHVDYGRCLEFGKRVPLDLDAAARQNNAEGIMNYGFLATVRKRDCRRSDGGREVLLPRRPDGPRVDSEQLRALPRGGDRGRARP
jgi:TPR repeat protein